MKIEAKPLTPADEDAVTLLWARFQAMTPEDRARAVQDIIAGAVKRVPQ